MNPDKGRIARYLQQLSELGGPDLFLGSMDRAAALKALAGDSALGAPTARTRSGRESLAAVLNEGRSDQRESGAGVVRGAPRPTVSAAAPRTRKAALRSPTAEVTAGLTTLADAAAACTRCGLHAGRQQVVFGEGNAAADLVVVGEAPGQEEDKTGRPFVGRAGRLLDLLLLSSGFPRKEVYICNVLKCRPPNNRNPQADEMDLCTRNFLYGQLDLIAPRALLAVGRFAVQALLETTESIGRLRGRLHTYRGTPLIVSYHPAYLLRSPNMVRAAWSDYQLARTVLDEPV